MDSQSLAALEQAIEPYRQAGFVVTTQSEGAMTLTYPPEKFNYGLFILLLLLFWPAAVLHLISFNNRRNRSVCFRITSQGYIEESGYTLDMAGKERTRERWVLVFVIGFFLFLALGAIMILMTPQTRL